jgi:hypothetical protein
MKNTHNNATISDGLGQRAYGAPPKTAGYGERCVPLEAAHEW